jgi:hypothetical protein
MRGAHACHLDLPVTLAGPSCAEPTVLTVEAEAMTVDLQEVLVTYRRRLDLDEGAIKATLATVVANQLEGPPVWLMLVGPPSSGKTEVLRPLLGIQSIHQVSKLTEAALLSGTSKQGRDKSSTGGLLREVGDEGILLVPDFSTVLSMNADARSSLFAAFRDIYDGHYSRHLGVDGGTVLRWRGKLGMISAVTPAIDSHHEAVSNLGERWVYYRPPDGDPETHARQALATVGDEREMRAASGQLVSEFMGEIDTASKPALDDRASDFLVNLATFAVRCRSSVERDPRSRDIVAVPTPEMPGRLTGVLAQLWRGCVLLGNDEVDTRRLVRKIALDGMPANRRGALEFLSLSNEPKSVGMLTAHLQVSTSATRRVLEDLDAHKIVQVDQFGKEYMYELTAWAREKLTAIAV